MVIDLIGESVELTVSENTRETVNAVRELSRDTNKPLSVKEISEKLKLDKSTTLRRVRVAIDQGYLKNLEEKKGRTAKIIIGIDLPEETKILPTVDEIEGCRVASNSEGNNVPPGVNDKNNEIHLDELPDDINAWPEELKEAFEERAAVLEFEGGMGKKEAEVMAEKMERGEKIRNNPI